MLAKIHSVKLVQAVKNHICSFSGDVISKGKRYYSISWHPADMNLDFDAETFKTYKVSQDSMADFIKGSAFFVPDIEDEELSNDVETVEGVLHSFWDKWKDRAGITDLLKTVKNRLRLPIQ